MTRRLFITLLILHAGIHALAFVRAYELAQVFPFTEVIGRPLGAVALVCAALFLWTARQVYHRVERWRWPASLGVLISCGLILISWPDAAIGLLPNALIALAIIRWPTS